CVLWLHGFVDYFFHSHVAHAFDRAGLRFFALDLRRYGRSLRPANRPCYATRADEYFLEISAALEELSQGRQVGLFAHSTGGLIAAVYAARGPRADLVSRLVLNSPFLKFPTSFVEEVKLRVATLLAPV